MRTAEGFGRAPGGPAEDHRLFYRAAERARDEEIRCPSCSRLLVLRSGPAITAHFAHRPRQSCRRPPARSGITPLRLEQLTLFDVADLGPPESLPVTVDSIVLGPAPSLDPAPEPRVVPNPRRRRRRRAWLPRLIRWIKGQPQPWAAPAAAAPTAAMPVASPPSEW